MGGDRAGGEGTCAACLGPCINTENNRDNEIVKI